MIAMLLAVSLWTPAVALAIGADAVTTQQGIRAGLVEKNPNPIMRSLAGRVAMQSAELGLITVALHHKDKRIRKAGKVAAVASILIHGTAAVLNSQRHR